MKYILVNGKKRAGKDFFAKELKKELEALGHKVSIMAFADPIKDIIATTFDITRGELDDFKNDENEILLKESYKVLDMDSTRVISDFRLLLQRFGTEAMQATFGKQVWVDLLIKMASECGSDYVIVPDFRFLSEHIPGAITVKVINRGVKYDSVDSHRSENELNMFDFMYLIDNTNKPDITKQVQDFIRFVMLYQTELELNSTV